MIKINPEINPAALTKKIRDLRSDMVSAVYRGNYKEYKSALKEHAKLAVDNFELTKEVKSPNLNVPIFKPVKLPFFKKVRLMGYIGNSPTYDYVPRKIYVPSKQALRMAKVWFLDLFRVKTPEEKLLKKMVKQEKLKQEAQKYMHDSV